MHFQVCSEKIKNATNGFQGSACTEFNGTVAYDNHVPTTLAMSGFLVAEMSNTLVVGYPDYVLLTPSSAPSESPSVSKGKVLII